MRHWWWVTVAIIVATTTAAQSQPFFGDGAAGDLVVDAGVTLFVNASSALAASVDAGTGVITVLDSTSFRPGGLVMVVQSQTPSALPEMMGELDLSGSQVGRYEFARVATVVGSAVTLTQPLTLGFDAPGAQLIAVPQYRRVTLEGTIGVTRWDGARGGIVVLLASESITGSGRVLADGAGFRSANATRSDGVPMGSLYFPAGVTLEVGEGLRAGALYGQPVGTTGGASANDSAGRAGGGSHIGSGGAGAQSRDGRAGLYVRYAQAERLVMGGGGGVIGGTDSLIGFNRSAGGGVVFVASPSVTGTIQFSANATSDAWHAGSAGGLVRLETSGVLECRSARALGSGGRSYGGQGTPGGGGGGGRVVLIGSLASCAASALAGIGGTSSGGGSQVPPLTDNDVSAVGDVIVMTPAAAPPTPIISEPQNLASVSSTPSLTVLLPTSMPGLTVRVFIDGVEAASGTTTDDGFSTTLSSPLSAGWHRLSARTFNATSVSQESDSVYVFVGATAPAGFRITSEPVTTATCGSPYGSAEVPTVEPPGAASFVLEPVEGADLPADLHVDSATGALYWTPSITFHARVPVRLVATRGAQRAEQVFVIDVACDRLKVGCGCSSTSASLLTAWVFLLVLTRLRRARDVRGWPEMIEWACREERAIGGSL